MSSDKRYRQCGFTLLETVVVIAVIMIVSAMAMPTMVRIIDLNKLQGSAQEYASFLQQARGRAVQDDQFYQVLNTTTGGNNPMVYLDMQPINGSLDAGELQVQLPAPVVITDVGAPAGFDTTTLLGTIPLYASNTNEPAMTAGDGLQRAGLAFNGRGLPCQRYSATAACSVAPVDGGGNVVTVAWVTYLKYQSSLGGTSWAAVTITPAGRIKTWTYNSGAGQWQ